MKIAVILFTYNRSSHTATVLEALRKNVEKPDKLFIFQDGLKPNTDVDEWNAVSRVICSQDWCEVEVIRSEKNKGLTKSVVWGVDLVFQEYDAVIVLEDDCVPHPMFMTYMKSALEQFRENEKVYSIGGYAWPVDVEENGTDTYFTKRISSCGWATWKNRWKKFDQDYRILSRIKKDDYLLKQMHIWGEDLERYLLGNIYGRCDSWAVFWALNVIEHDGYCVSPYRSLIDNIGFDGSGTHSGTVKRIVPLMESDRRSDFVFSKDLSISMKTEEAFSYYFGWTPVGDRNKSYYEILLKWMRLHGKKKTILEYFTMRNISSICIWGRGDVCDLLLQELDGNVEIQAIIESRPASEQYQDIIVVDPENIPPKTQMIIVIPEYDIKRIVYKTRLHDSDMLVVGIGEAIDSILEADVE